MAPSLSKNFLGTGDDDIALHLLLEGIYLKYGYDFRSYSRPMVKRQILRRLQSSGFKSILELQNWVLTDPEYFEEVLLDFSINFTELFRNPSVYKALRNKVIPVLQTYPSLNIWHAGCSTGQEVYSMAILLHEEGLLEKSQIYATDISIPALDLAKAGVYPADRMEMDRDRYREAGGKAALTDDLSIRDDSVAMPDFLKKRIFFSDHNLVTDQVFAEMHLILCRNVLIYFERNLRTRIFELFHESLCNWGFLCLGSDEVMEPSELGVRFKSFLELERIYRQIPSPV